jgi:hypothetical protein
MNEDALIASYADTLRACIAYILEVKRRRVHSSVKHLLNRQITTEERRRRIQPFIERFTEHGLAMLCIMQDEDWKSVHSDFPEALWIGVSMVAGDRESRRAVVYRGVKVEYDPAEELPPPHPRLNAPTVAYYIMPADMGAWECQEK